MANNIKRLVRFEQGHADAAGSTIRTLHVIVLVTTLVPIFMVAVIRLAGTIAAYVNAVP